MTTFKIRGTYSFDVYPTSVIGNNFKNVTVLAIMDRETADKEIDTQSTHIQCYPFLPVGTPNSPDGYDYIKLKMPSGQTTIIGMAFINEATVESNDWRTITAIIGNVSTTDLPRVKDALFQNGFTAVELKISS